MSARTRCRVCGWRCHYRKQHAGRRATRTHICLPAVALEVVQ
ncbi:hypothetical protein [Streptomyces mashuensis]|nr:hypothetical protein [Streptomyces mashuensis]